MIGLSLASFGLCMAAVQGALVGPLIRRFGERRTVLGGFMVETVTYSFLSFNTSGLLALTTTPVSALGGVTGPALQALGSQSTPENQQGEFAGYPDLYQRLGDDHRALGHDLCVWGVYRPRCPGLFPRRAVFDGGGGDGRCRANLCRQPAREFGGLGHPCGQNRGDAMKIKDLEIFVVAPPAPGWGGRYWIFPKITTDNGIVGYGECYASTVGPKAMRAVIEDVFDRHMLGENPETSS